MSLVARAPARRGSIQHPASHPTPLTTSRAPETSSVTPRSTAATPVRCAGSIDGGPVHRSREERVHSGRSRQARWISRGQSHSSGRTRDDPRDAEASQRETIELMRTGQGTQASARRASTWRPSVAAYPQLSDHQRAAVQPLHGYLSNRDQASGARGRRGRWQKRNHVGRRARCGTGCQGPRDVMPTSRKSRAETR